MTRNIKQKNRTQSGGSFFKDNLWLILRIIGLTFMLLGVAYMCESDPLHEENVCSTLYPNGNKCKDVCMDDEGTCIANNTPCFLFLYKNTFGEPFWIGLIFAIIVSVYTLVRTFMKIDNPNYLHIPFLTEQPINLMTLSGLILLLTEFKQVMHRGQKYSFLGFIDCNDEKSQEAKGTGSFKNFTNPKQRGGIFKIIALICLLMSAFVRNKWEKYNKKHGRKYTPFISLLINTLQDPFWLGGLLFLLVQVKALYMGTNDVIEFEDIKCENLEVNMAYSRLPDQPLYEWKEKSTLRWKSKEGAKTIFFLTKLVSFATGTLGVSALGTAF